MKIKILSFAVLCCMAATAYAQSDCSAFFPMGKGSTWELTHFNKKGAVTSVSSQEVSSAEQVESVWEAQVRQKLSDDQGKLLNESSFVVKCQDGTVFFELIDMLSPEMKEGLGSLEMTLTGESLALPSRLSVGQALPDARTEIKAGPGGVTIMTLRFDITDRKVEAKETVAVAAGKFDCYKITYTLTTRTIVTKTFTSAVWYSEKVGMVKSETYDKKGNLESRTELSKFKL